MAKRKDNAAIVAERFPSDVASHVMTIVKDDGMHRHIVFRNPDSGFCWFDIVTWPGFLCITGDCGCYVFSCVEDMLTLFRRYREPDFYYWTQKVVAADRNNPSLCKGRNIDRYVWCCHAILWGIQQYDAAKAKTDEPALTA